MIIQNLRSLYALRRIHFQDDIAAVLNGDEGKELKIQLAEMAFDGDDDTLARVLGDLTRK